MPDAKQRTRNTSYGPALDGPLTHHRLTPEQAEAKAAEAAKKKEQEAENREEVKEFKDVYAKAMAKYHEQLDKYEKAKAKHDKAVEDAEVYGTKMPKMPAILAKGEPTWPSHQAIASQAEKNVKARKTGGTRRRHRKHRSTRRR